MIKKNLANSSETSFCGQISAFCGGLSVRAIVLAGKYPCGEKFSGNCPAGNCPAGKCPGIAFRTEFESESRNWSEDKKTVTVIGKTE